MIDFAFRTIDLWTEFGSWPFNSFVSVYRFASENPWCWKILYESSRSAISRSLFLSSGYAVSGNAFVKVFREYRPDLVISVHPLCQHVPLQILAENNDLDAYFVTIVTDLGSAHPTWFHPQVDRLYVPSDALRRNAIAEGVSPSKIRLFGLPLRRAFWSLPSYDASQVPTLLSPRLKVKRLMRARLDLALEHPTCMLVGGGEGVGKIDDLTSAIVQVFLANRQSLERIYKLTCPERPLSDIQSCDRRTMQLLVVCGKNEGTRQRVLSGLKQIQAKIEPYTHLRLIVDDRSVEYRGPGALDEPGASGPRRCEGEGPREGEGPPPCEGPPHKGLLESFRSWWLMDTMKSKSKNSSKEKTDDEDSTNNKNTPQSGLSSIEMFPSPSEDAYQNESSQILDERSTYILESSILGNMSSDPSSVLCLENNTGHLQQVHNSSSSSKSESNDHVLIQADHEADHDQIQNENDHDHDLTTSEHPSDNAHEIRVVVYGFISNIDEIMAASNLIVTKAGPGTIAEASTRGLPVLISSYLPGQEEGNVEFVLENKFGTYCEEPQAIGLIVRQWLTNENYTTKLRNMSIRSARVAYPQASLQIAMDIGSILSLSPLNPRPYQFPSNTDSSLTLSDDPPQDHQGVLGALKTNTTPPADRVANTPHASGCLPRPQSQPSQSQPSESPSPSPPLSLFSSGIEGEGDQNSLEEENPS